MNITITTPASGGTIAAIASKSMAHRLLICAALSREPSRIVCSETSDDITATARCLTALGTQIDYEDGVFTVSPIPRPVLGERTLDAGESGSTLRFMLPVACALGADTTFLLRGRLPSRPLSPLYEELIAHNSAISAPGFETISTSGLLAGGNYKIPGGVSSQFVSGLLFALPILEDESIITVTGAVESRAYIDMTLSALDASGITVRHYGSHYMIAGNQEYERRGAAAVEGDWSNAAFWLCLGAIGSAPVTVTNLNTESIQGDKAVLDILKQFGAVIRHSTGGVTVSRSALKGININASDTPDLVPVLAAVASVAEGETVIYNARRLRIKESDRLKTLTETLGALGADITETDDGLLIRGKPHLDGGTVDAHGDHRIAMTAAVAAAVSAGPVTISNAESVNKSYPGFFRDYTALGGCVEEA